MIPRPAPGDYADFFHGYVARVPDGDVLAGLAAQGKSMSALVRAAGEARGDYAYAAGKWSVKRLLLHVTDGERILGLGDLGAVTWGTNLYWASNDSALLTGSWWTFVPTGLGVALVGFGLTMINFGIDEVTNPRLAAARAQDRGPGVQPTPVLRRAR